MSDDKERAMKRNRASELRAIADGRLLLNVRNGVTVSRSMLAMIADEFEAMSTALAAKDEELAEVKRDRAELALCAIAEEKAKTRALGRAEAAEAQLAGARKALVEIETQSRLVPVYSSPVTLGQILSSKISMIRDIASRAARRALEGGADHD